MHVESIAASLLFGLSWILVGVGAVLVSFGLAAQLDWANIPTVTRTDLLGAGICLFLALLTRLLGYRFRRGA